MRRFLGALCSSVAGILTFVFLSIPFVSLNAENATLQEATSYTGWEILQSDLLANMDGYNLVKIFIIVSIVIACLLIIMAVLSLLKETNIIKTSANFNFYAFLLLILLTVSSVVLIIGVSNLGSYEILGETIKPCKAKVGAILNIVFAGICTVLAIFSTSSSGSKKKRKRK